MLDQPILDLKEVTFDGVGKDNQAMILNYISNAPRRGLAEGSGDVQRHRRSSPSESQGRGRRIFPDGGEAEAESEEAQGLE